MRGLVLRDVGKIKIEEVNKPSPEADEVLLKVVACGVCGSDIPRAFKDGAHNMPLIIGHEFSGVVEELGANVDNSWLGKRVGVFPLIPCMECQRCKNRKYEMCKSYSYLGSRRDGGFAEYVKVPAWNLIELPEGVTMEQAAMLEPMAVAVHAIRTVQPMPNEKVVVMGLGTIGLLVTMFLLDMGIKNVYTIGNKKLQQHVALELGVTKENYFDYSSGKLPQSADVFFECVGKTESLVAGIDMMVPSGRVCTVGNPHGDMNLPRATYWKILRNQLRLCGTWNSSFGEGTQDDWHYVLDRLQQGRIHPEKLISHRFEFENVLEGFELMRDKREEYVKVMGEMIKE